MLLKNAEVLNGIFRFVKADLRINSEIIEDIGELPSYGSSLEDEIDLEGLRVIPGLIDMHIHGSAGCDCCDATPEALAGMSEYLASNGVTSFAPASMSLSYQSLEKVFKNIREAKLNGLPGAYIQGINMEGPYFSVAKRGAQNKEFIRKPDIEEFDKLNAASGNLIKVVDVAPEVEGAQEFITEISKRCLVSVAHTTANYEQTMNGFKWGAKHATHLYNAMEGLTHREPGTVGAIFDSRIASEIICDGVHIHQAAIRIAWQQLGADKMVLISDAMSAAGMKDGNYFLGGQQVIVAGGAARLHDGSLAGSTANLMKCVKKAVEFGITPENAVKAASMNPARELGVDKTTGSIEPGKFADLVVVDKEFNIKAVIIKGRVIFNKI